MKHICKQPWCLCGLFIIITRSDSLKYISFGNQKLLPLTVLMNRIFITPRLFSYSSFRIWYDFTVDEICSLQLVSLLQTHTSQSCTLIFRKFHIWFIGVVNEICVIFGVEMCLKRRFYLFNIPK
jgi:hypothetical protein